MSQASASSVFSAWLLPTLAFPRESCNVGRCLAACPSSLVVLRCSTQYYNWVSRFLLIRVFVRIRLSICSLRCVTNLLYSIFAPPALITLEQRISGPLSGYFSTPAVWPSLYCSLPLFLTLLRYRPLSRMLRHRGNSLELLPLVVRFQEVIICSVPQERPKHRALVILCRHMKLLSVLIRVIHQPLIT